MKLFIGLLFASIIITFANADVSHLLKPDMVTDTCLGCICEASSGCDQSLRCAGDVCGLFRITQPYWLDGGKQTLNGETSDSPTAYANCANDPLCAARTIQGYMKKFAQDCNGDGETNCYDFAAIHKFGGFGCKNALPDVYARKFNECIAVALRT